MGELLNPRPAALKSIHRDHFFPSAGARCHFSRRPAIGRSLRQILSIFDVSYRGPLKSSLATEFVRPRVLLCLRYEPPTLFLICPHL